MGNHIYRNLIYNLYIYPQLESDSTNFILGKDTCLNSVEIFYKDFSGSESAIKNFGRRLHSSPPINKILIYLYHILFRRHLSCRIFLSKNLNRVCILEETRLLLHTVHNIPQINHIWRSCERIRSLLGLDFQWKLKLFWSQKKYISKNSTSKLRLQKI